MGQKLRFKDMFMNSREDISMEMAVDEGATASLSPRSTMTKAQLKSHLYLR